MRMPLSFADHWPFSRWGRWALVLLIAASFAVQLHDLDAKSLWSDEGLTLRRAEQPLGLVFKNLNLIPTAPDYHDGSGSNAKVIQSPDLHPPLYFLLLHFWIQVAGQSEFALRFPSVIGMTLALPLLFALARALLSKEAGLWAALLAAFSPFYLWYAQEARMYAWVVVLSLASVTMLLRLLKNAPRRRDYLIYATVTMALLYTHYSGFLLLAFEGMVYGIHRLRKQPRQALVILGLLGVALIPLLPYAWRTLQLRGLFGFAYRPLHLILAEGWSSFSLGLEEPVIRPLWQTAPFLVLFGIGVLMLSAPRRRQAWAICLGYLLLPVLLLYGLSFLKPNYMNPRHLIVSSPAWELVMAQGLATLRRRVWPGLVVFLGAVLLLRGGADYDVFTAHNMWKDDIRGAAEYIEARARPGDAIVLHHPVIGLTFDYYYDGPYPEIAIPGYRNSRDTARAQAEFEAWAQRYDRIWFLYGPPPTFFPHDFLPNWADANLFKVYEQGFEARWTFVGVAAYDDGPPVFDALPTDAEPRDVSWGPLNLVGFRAAEASAGENEWLAFYWRVEGDLPDEPLTLVVRLLDQAGTVWLERTEQVLPFYPPAKWPAGQLVQTEFRLPLPDDMPPVSYFVEVEPAGQGGPEVVGQTRVSRPTERGPAPRPRARFEGGLELLANTLTSARFRAGYPLLGSLTWRAATRPSSDYHVRVRLADLRGREVAYGEMPPSAAGFPTSAWLPDDRVAGQLAFPLPADLESGSYQVQIGLVDTADGTVARVREWYGKHDWLTIGTVRVDAWPLLTQMPADVAHRLENVHLGEAIDLRGYDLVRDGEMLLLTLYWQANRSPEVNYHVFVHLGAPDASPITQADGVPGEWLRPTTTWRPDEVIADPYSVSLAGVPPGRYDLLVGLYDPENAGQRPTTIVDDEIVTAGYVLLQTLEVGQ